MKSFWLIALENDRLSVSLAQNRDGGYLATSIGPWLPWDETNESFVVSQVDQSLSTSAAQISLPEKDEPTLAAFVLPPFWVGNDGKIVGDKLKIIENICRQLKLSPMGFIADDEAIIEESNTQEGLAVSFILLHFSQSSYTLSLVYLGKVRERLRQEFSLPFDPLVLENSLLRLDSQSTLPPEIIIFGDADPQLVDSIKNYHWVGKKDIETFLHFPDVKSLVNEDIISTYIKSIALQIVPGTSVSHGPKVELEPEIVDEPINTAPEIITQDIVPDDNLELVTDASEFGFSLSEPETTPTPQPSPVNQLPTMSVDEYQQAVATSEQIPRKISLPKFRFPNLKKIFLILIGVSPLFILIPFYFSQANIALYVTAFDFSRSADVTLSTTPQPGSLLVKKQIFNLTTSSSIKTTGTKTIGNRSQGEVTIFNKQDKIQNIPKGAILVDISGKKFELTTAVQIASSSSNLDQGVITLGLTKGVVSATDIGPEYNLNKDVRLTFKDFPETSIIAKANQAFSGGSREQISAVSTADKTAVEAKLNQDIASLTDQKIKTDLPALTGVIKETIQIKKNHMDISREVGEEADTLTGTLDGTVSVFVVDDVKKADIISQILSLQPNFNLAQIEPKNFTFSFKPDKINDSSAHGVLTVTGKSLPKIDVEQLKKKISGKSKATAAILLKSSSPRVYKYKIATNFNFLSFINPLPFRTKNINIDIISNSP